MSDFRNNTKCLYNDSGFCKYGEKCRKTHHKSICLRNNCDKKCNSRHPKPCKFKAKCKFLAKAICAFKHENDEKDLDDLKRQIESLKQENKDEKCEFVSDSKTDIENHTKSKHKEIVTSSLSNFRFGTQDTHRKLPI